MALFDLIQSAMGRPDPSMAIAHALGQAPGQPGSPQGPQPLAGATPPGAPAGQGGAPGASGAPPGPPQAPPQPQATQTPPDLGQMFVQLMQRQQASEGFNRGLGMLAAGFAQPRDRATMIDAMSGQSGDAGSTMGNIMRLQQWNIQQQQHAQLVQALPKMLEQAGLDQSYAPLVLANPDFLAKVVEAQTGVSGDPVQRELAQSRREWHQNNPGKTDSDMIAANPSLAGPVEFQAGRTQATTDAATKTKDLVADQHNFAPALTNYDKGIGLVDQFMQPDMQEGAKEFLGTTGQLKPVAMMSDKGKAAWALYKQIMATQFSAGTQDFKGAGRITQQELTQDAPSQSTMGQLNQAPTDFFNGVQKYRDQLAQHRANLFGAAQRATDPRLSDEDYAKYVAPNIDVFGGSARDIPDFSKMNDDDATAAVAKLPSGKVFIGPDGQPHKKS